MRHGFVKRWPKQAAAFRREMLKEERASLDLSYGKGERNLVDIFYPENEPKGLLVFVHGGYWYRFDKSDWSHLAAGALDNGWIVAMPSYTLCPDITISGITREVAKAIEFVAADIKGPIRLAGHSAGGQLGCPHDLQQVAPFQTGSGADRTYHGNLSGLGFAAPVLPENECHPSISPTGKPKARALPF